MCVHVATKSANPSDNPMARGRCEGQKGKLSMNAYMATSLATLNARIIAPRPDRLQC